VSEVDFSDTDVTGVVYDGRYPALFDRAIVAYRRRLGNDRLGPVRPVPPGSRQAIDAFEQG
jgi:acyl-CoA thioesterase FadM